MDDKKGKATKLLEVFLLGMKVNRKHIGKLKIGKDNDSAHSLVSTLQNRRYIPIERERTSDGTNDYYMSPEERARFKDPELRKQQREETKAIVEKKRKKRINALLEKSKGVK